MQILSLLARPLSKDSFLELKYEDLYSDPLNTFRTVTEFCELEWTAEFERDRETRAKEHQRQVQARPTAHQQRNLEEVLGDYLGKYDYL